MPQLESMSTYRGRVSNPSYYGQEPQSTSKATPSNAPAYAALVLIGVALVFIMRNRDKTQTGPVLNLVPSYEADISQINNITATLNRMASPEFPAGGTLPSIVWSPNA